MSIIEKAISRLDDTQPEEEEKGVTSELPSIKPQRIHIDAQRLCGLDPSTTQGLLPYLADEYRRIKRPLLANAFGRQAHRIKDGNLILITSSVPGEGKSFTAGNLALSIATERDRTVLLIDGDIAKSRITQITGLESQKGLVDLLLDDTLDITDVLVKTDFPRLSIIPSGGMHHPHVTELFASERMAHILNEISNRYSNRIILFDAPPLLVTPETQILCDLMGQIALVVETGVTPKHIVNQALAMIGNENKDKEIGLILNKASGFTGGYDYSYGYGAET